MRIFGWGTWSVLGFFAVVGLYGTTVDYYAHRAADIKMLAENVYYEASNEPDLAARMVAYVTYHRAEENRPYWGGSDIANVVVARAEAKGTTVCQFSWTCGPRHRAEAKLARPWARAQRIAREQMDGDFAPPPGFAQATAYLNPRYASRKGTCYFKTHLVRLGAVEPGSQHVFYRQPETKAERTLLPRPAQVPECGHRKRA